MSILAAAAAGRRSPDDRGDRACSQSRQLPHPPGRQMLAVTCAGARAGAGRVMAGAAAAAPAVMAAAAVSEMMSLRTVSSLYHDR